MTTATDALAMALSAEHAAIYGYGVVGAHLDQTTQATAHETEVAHRNRRDNLLLRLSAAKVTAPAAAAAYTLPFPVTDRDSALKLAVSLEEGTARAWRSAVGATEGDDRKLALDALTDCAVRATHWKKTAGISPTVVPFPGAPV
jgi:ferritin-like protein